VWSPIPGGEAGSGSSWPCNFRRICVSLLNSVSSSKIRILICDDHTLFVEGVKAMLRNEPSLEIVGEARDGRQAVELVKHQNPDIILMDVSMPDMNGFEATHRVHQSNPDVKVLMLTMHDEEELVARCLEAGAAG
jgi:DNA-binding NarL/FixJ family response regulator